MQNEDLLRAAAPIALEDQLWSIYENGKTPPEAKAKVIEILLNRLGQGKGLGSGHDARRVLKKHL